MYNSAHKLYEIFLMLNLLQINVKKFLKISWSLLFHSKLLLLIFLHFNKENWTRVDYKFKVSWLYQLFSKSMKCLTVSWIKAAFWNMYIFKELLKVVDLNLFWLVFTLLIKTDIIYNFWVLQFHTSTAEYWKINYDYYDSNDFFCYFCFLLQGYLKDAFCFHDALKGREMLRYSD